MAGLVVSDVAAPPSPRGAQEQLMEHHANRGVHHSKGKAFGKVAIQASHSTGQQQAAPQNQGGRKRQPRPPAEYQTEQEHRWDHDIHLPRPQ